MNESIELKGASLLDLLKQINATLDDFERQWDAAMDHVEIASKQAA